LYHATFVRPPPAMWRRIVSVIFSFVGGMSPSDVLRGAAVSHPARHTAALPWLEGGINLVAPDVHADCLRAKVTARLLQPGRHAWKLLVAARLVDAVPSLGPAVAVSGLQVTTRLLPPRLAAYLSGFQQTLPHRLLPPPRLSHHQVLAERLFHNRQVRGPDGAVLDPVSPAWEPLAAAGIYTVGRLRDAMLAGPTLALHIAWGCVPASWRAVADQPPPAGWQLCRDGAAC
jgi:hypothetical protein